MKKQPVDISGYLVSKYGASFRNQNWRMSCPFCFADRDRFTVSIPKGLVHCWRCNYTNSVLGFVSEVESVDFAGAFRIIRKYAIIRTPRVVRNKPTTAKIKRSIPGYKKLRKVKQPSPMERLAFGYLKQRGLTYEDIKFWGLGISETEKYNGRIISPFIEEGKLKYFITRTYINSIPKYLNPSLDEWGVGKSELLYNYEVAKRFKHINIVEGVYDTYAAGRNSVALLGKKPSSHQLSKIMMMNPDSVNIMLDSDAKNEAFELAEILNQLFPTKVTLYKKGDPASNRIAIPDNKEEVQYSFKAHISNKLNEND